MSASNGDNAGRRNNYRPRYSQAKKPANGTDGTRTQERTGKGPQLSREERGQNLQYRNVNMHKYDQMIDSAKDNFADIKFSNGAKEECTICCKNNDLFGVGSCRHPVCIECAIRIRVLSNSRQCPVCRTDMETLCFIFVENGLDSIPSSLRLLDHPDESRFGLRFQSVDALNRYEKYLTHVCKLCKSPEGERLEFPTFVALRHHMSSIHQLTYCHICTENIILFSRERKTYTRDGLQRHIRAGDRDDKSLKGHPSCLFCEQRFFDEEARYRHLRKEHFFCQFCESEGKHLNVFFRDHGELVSHYKEKHFLCDFEECKAMGIAFSNQIDLNLHKSKEHSNRRAAVGLDFQFSDRQLAGPSRIRAPANPPVIRREKIAVVPQEQPAAPKRTADEFVVVPSAQTSSRFVRCSVGPVYTPQNEDFPSLAPTSGSFRADPALTNLRPDNFPRLTRVNHPGGQPVNMAKPSGRASPGSSSSGLVPTASHQSQMNSVHAKPPTQAVEDFPALPVKNKQSLPTSVWGGKKGSKSVIVSCKVPNNVKQLPQPDVWPDRPVTTPAREIEPEQWHEVPVKPRKVDKKSRPAQQKAVKSTNGPTQEQLHSNEERQQPDSAETNDLKVGSEVRSKERKQKENRNQNSADTTSETNFKNEAPTVPASTSASHEIGESCSVTESDEQKFTRNAKDNDAALKEVERSAEESAQNATSKVDTSSQPSILDWFSLPSKSSLFSNLSLSNVLGTKQQQKCGAPAPVAAHVSEDIEIPPTSVAADPVKSERTTFEMADAPPGLVTAGDNILSGPPPGFEGICPESLAPPGLAAPSTTRPVFSMAPFFSSSDLGNNTGGSDTVVKGDSEWSTIGAK